VAIAKKNTGWLLPLVGTLTLASHLLLMHFSYGLDWRTSIIEGVLNTTILGLGVWVIILFINSYPTQVGAMIYGLVIASVLSAIITYSGNLALSWWFDADRRYLQWLGNTLPAKYIITWMIFAWAASYSVIKKKARILEERFLKHKDASELLRDAELFKLRQQLQPHFLYNSLNSISALVMIQPDKAQDMIGRLSEFLRSSVKREAEELIPIADELSFIEAYLSIEAVRFGDRLKVDLVKGDTGHATIPPFLLQPLLENAIKFGLYGKTGSVVISVHISMEDQMLRITISNPYDEQTSPPRGTGFGIQGIQRRLELLYARTNLLEIKKQEDIFTTILNIPQANA
jgi:two-component system LytT family sensor kinase